MTTRQRTRGTTGGGFTLLEVMISLTILALGLLTMAAMNLHAIQGGKKGRDQSHAAAVAHSQLERLQRLPWAQVAPTGWTAPATATVAVQAANGSNQQVYQVSWRITDVVANWRRAIDVRVTWDDVDRPNRSITLSSFRYNREGV